MHVYKTIVIAFRISASSLDFVTLIKWQIPFYVTQMQQCKRQSKQFYEHKLFHLLLFLFRFRSQQKDKRSCEFFNLVIGVFPYLRSSSQRCSMKKDVLRNFTKFTGKHLCQSSFFNRATLLKTRSGTGVLLWILRNF